MRRVVINGASVRRGVVINGTSPELYVEWNPSRVPTSIPARFGCLWGYVEGAAGLILRLGQLEQSSTGIEKTISWLKHAAPFRTHEGWGRDFDAYPTSAHQK